MNQNRVRYTLANIPSDELAMARDSLRLLKSKIAKAHQTKDGSLFDTQRTFSKQKYDKIARLSQTKRSQPQNKKGNPPVPSRPQTQLVPEKKTTQTRKSTAIIKQQPIPKQPQRRVGSQFEEIPIALLKKKQQIPAEDEQQVRLFQCKKGCGRKFNQDSIAKHEHVCQKIFQQKRKAFDSKQQRLDSDQFKELNYMPKASKMPKKQQKQKQKPIMDKKQKWKAQSQALRMAMKSIRGDLTVEQKAKQKQLEMNDYVKCKFCNRHFNQTAGARHMIHCEKKTKEMAIRNYNKK